MPIAASDLPSPQAPCQCQTRAHQTAQAVEFASDPPPDLTGRLAYGYTISLPIAMKVIHSMVGEKKLHDFQIFALFELAFQKAVIAPVPRDRRGSRIPTFEVLRNIPSSGGEDYALEGFVITVATGESKALPPKEVLDRLKAFLETDAGPRWYEI
ncbi:hypothetical protein SCHPADRAFT_576917 [Schizopora paradoxa]|uniref:Uncharacterized protein n=1 Tax=Schizopora paradoxa TaxID=27342 RepID=A0A0H2RIC9_9AGAM|nr:hypothetical protein SCHPADRAFT_576917 [Schizopora paradoxa]